MADHYQYNRYSGGCRETRKSRVTFVLNYLTFQPLYETQSQSQCPQKQLLLQRKTQRGRSPPLQKEKPPLENFVLHVEEIRSLKKEKKYIYIFLCPIDYIKYGQLISWVSISSMGLTKQEYRVTAARPPTMAFFQMLFEWREHAPLVSNTTEAEVCNRRAIIQCYRWGGELFFCCCCFFSSSFFTKLFFL